MTANTVDAVKWAALNSNIGSGVVGNPAAIEAALDDVRAVVDQHATEINGKLPLSGGTMTSNQIFNNSFGVYGKDTGGTNRSIALVDNSNRVALGALSTSMLLYCSGTCILVDGTRSTSIVIGTGSPEGVVTANVGSLFLRSDGAATTTLYVKTSGTGNTGWTAK